MNKSSYGFYAGIAIFALPFVFDPAFEGLSVNAWRTMGLAGMMATWWVTECVPIPVTSFLPLILAPFVGVASLKETATSYSHPLIFLFLGGFALSLAIERVGLHTRIARMVVASAGANPKRQIGGLMLVTAGLSMWMSNTATAVIMLPIALSMTGGAGGERRYGTALLLGVAYSASIGGLATLVGTPPNALLAAYLQSNYGIEIGFGRWMLFGVPFSLVLLALAWLLLTRGVPGALDTGDATREVRRELKAMGAMSSGERRVAAVFGVTAFAWMFRSVLVDVTGLELEDAGIAMTAALALFILPVGSGGQSRILDWKDTERLPWGILLLFGGGLALASMMKETGLADFIGESFQGLDQVSHIVVVLVVTLSVVFLTEITSNTATAATLLPLVGPVAVAFGESPASLAIPAAVAASCAFMLPVATPPNAIVFSSGNLRVSEMALAGLWLNIVAVGLLVASAAFFIPLIF